MTLDGVVPWPSDLAYAYRAAGVWRGRPLGAYLWDWAQRWADRIAVVDGAQRLSYLDLAIRADAAAQRMSEAGLERGDTVLLQLPNTADFVVVTLACFRLGVIPVMMLPQHREYELTSIGAHVGAKALIVAETYKGFDYRGLADRVVAALPRPAMVLVPGALCGYTDRAAARRVWLDALAPAGADVALFLLSGGTTGVPKLIARTHDDYEYNIRCCAARCGFDPRTVYLAVLPAGHNFPLANPGILGTLFCGGRVVMLGSPRPDAVFAAVQAERVTATSAVPAVALKWMEYVAEHRPDLSSLTYVHVGGSVLAPEVAARIGHTLRCRVQQVYGMAEGLICYTSTRADDDTAYFTQGTPISPYDELMVVGEDGHPVPPGEVGELLTRGPYTPRGYFGVPAQNAISFTPDGWYRTGDLVRITAEGNVVVSGRVKDLINRAGEKISAAEIETLIQEMPQVAEVAAVAMPDPQVGERVCVFVRVHIGHSLTLDDITAALVARGLASFKLPERLELVERIPLTPIGKPDKKALVSRFAG